MNTTANSEAASVLRTIQWSLVDANPERIIAAPARHLVQTQKSIATAVGFYADRIETHYREGVVVTYHRTVGTPVEQMTLWVAAQRAEEIRLHRARLETLQSVAARVARRRA